MTTFIWPYDGNTVSIIGTFNDWTPEPLTPGPKGFHISLDIPPGPYEYKFIVDGRRWCYDVLKPTSTDDRGNRNNTVTVGPVGAQGKKAQQQPQKQQEPKQKQEPKLQEPKHQEPKQEEPIHEEAAEEAKPQQQQGKGKGQQQGKQQQKKEQGKKGGVSAVARAQSINLIKTVKSYAVPFYVGDVDCEDSVEDVLETAKLFQAALPEVGCMLVSGGTTSFIVVAVVPADKTGTLKATEWIDIALSVVAGPPKAEGTDTLAHGVVAADPDKGIFPIKLKDLCRGPTFIMLRKRGLVKDESSDDEMFFLDE